MNIREIARRIGRETFVLALLSLGLGIFAGAVSWIAQGAVLVLLYGFSAAAIWAPAPSTKRLRLGTLILPWVLVYAVPAALFGSPYVYPLIVLPPLGAFVGSAVRTATERRSRPTRIASAVASTALLAAVAAAGMLNWLTWIHSPPVRPFPAPDLEFFDANGAAVSTSSLRGRVVVLDFWTTTCGVCYQKFPNLQALEERYRGNPDVAVFAVNLPIPGENARYANEFFKKNPFTFRRLSSRDPFERTAEPLGFNAVPAVIVIDKSGSVVYLGSMNTERFLFVNSLPRTIDRALARPAV